MDYIPSGSPLRGILKARILQYSRILSSHFFLQRIFLTQGSNLGLLHWRQSLYHLSHREAPKGIYKKQLDLQSSPGEQLLLYSLAQVSLPGYSLFVFLNLSYFSKKNKRERCTVSQAPGFWECEEDNTCLIFPFHTQFPWFFSPYAQDLSQKPAPLPSGICAPLSWALFQGDKQNLTWSRGYLHSYLPLSGRLSVCKRLLSKLFQGKKNYFPTTWHIF